MENLQSHQEDQRHPQYDLALLSNTHSNHITTGQYIITPSLI